ncbi:hypothetical protein HK405_002955 [Cladochytrium tenue]|nr:hypothetical protein HK405_002955 [Cladochytrium tenue]
MQATGGAEAADAALVVPAGSELVLPFRILLPTGQAALPPSVEGESGPEALGAPRDVVDSTRAFNIRYSLTVDITEPGAILRSPARHRETIFLPCLPRFNAVDARAVPASPDPESVANNVTCLLPVPVFAPTDAAAAAAANAAAVASALRISAPIGAPLAPGDSLPVSVAWLGPHPSSTELAAVSGLRVAIVDARLIELADLRELPAAAASAAVPAVAAWTAAALGTGARDARPVAAAELFVNAAAAAAAGDNTGPAASAQPSAPQQLQEHHVRIALRVPQLRPVRTLRGGLRAIGTGAPPSAAAATGGSSASSTAAPVAEPPADPTGVNPDCVVAPLPFSASAPTAAAAAVWSASVTHRLLVSVCVRLDSGAAGSPLPPPPASVAAAEAAEVAAAASTSRPAPEWRVVRAWAPVRVLSYSRAAAAAAAAALPATLSTQMQSVGLSPHRASHVAPTTPTADSSAAEQALPSRTTQKSAMPIPPGAGIPVVITPPAGHPSTSKAA